MYDRRRDDARQLHEIEIEVGEPAGQSDHHVSSARTPVRTYERHEPRCSENDEEDQPEMANPSLDRFPTVPQQVPERSERRRPRDRARGIEDQKAAPWQRARSGQNRADDAESRDEAGDEHRHRAVTRKEAI